ncbi:MAG TPA: hypothetical protein PLT45_09985 [Smithella sp.]|nr:hypothetical protein [Smithella sp.]
MNIKGTAFVTAKVTISQAFGEDRWNAFMAKMAQKDDFYKKMIMTVSLIPVEKHLFFLDELVKEFFNNDKKQYVIFGKVAAKFALSEGGVYHSFLLTKDLAQFVEKGMPKIWATLYDEGELTATLENNVVHLRVGKIPIRHVFFEYLTVGFFQQALKIFGRKSMEKCIKGFSKGDDEIYYQYELKD